MNVDIPADRDESLGLVRRAVAILVLSSIALLATGGGEFVHNLAHHHEDAGPLSDHDESNCVLHMQLRAPLMLESAVAALVVAGLFVAFLTLLAQQRIAQLVTADVPCRGPPALALVSAA